MAGIEKPPRTRPRGRPDTTDRDYAETGALDHQQLAYELVSEFYRADRRESAFYLLALLTRWDLAAIAIRAADIMGPNNVHCLLNWLERRGDRARGHR
jgi:hypothetical protein